MYILQWLESCPDIPLWLWDVDPREEGDKEDLGGRNEVPEKCSVLLPPTQETEWGNQIGVKYLVFKWDHRGVKNL